MIGIGQTTLLRARLRAEDWARTNGLSRWPALLRLAATMLSQGNELSGSIARYLVSAHPSRWQKRLAEMAVKSSKQCLLVLEQPASAQINRSILVKKTAGRGERGILIASFETELEKLVLSRGFPEVERAYQIVFLPTWQPCYSRALFLLAARATRPYVILPAGIDDLNLNSILGDLCGPLQFQASSWVAAMPAPSVRQRDIDILMLANFSQYKRHWRLFEALRDIPVQTKVVLAGRPWGGRTAQTLLDEARAFEADGRFQIVEDPTDTQVADLLLRAKLFCALSHKEGSYIAIAEALIAGTPVAMYANAMVGSKVFVRPETGFLLDPGRSLGPQLMEALRCAPSLDPAPWSRREISAEANSIKFNEALRLWSAAHGELWSTDAVPFYCRNFKFDYLQPEDRTRFQDDYSFLLQTAGLTLSDFPAKVLADPAVPHGSRDFDDIGR